MNRITEATQSLNYPEIFANNKVLKQLANKVLAPYDRSQQQSSLNYLSKRIKVERDGRVKPIKNPLAYLKWLLVSIEMDLI